LGVAVRLCGPATRRAAGLLIQPTNRPYFFWRVPQSVHPELVRHVQRPVFKHSARVERQPAGSFFVTQDVYESVHVASVDDFTVQDCAIAGAIDAIAVSTAPNKIAPLLFINVFIA
jgi:hypothetical protein